MIKVRKYKKKKKKKTNNNLKPDLVNTPKSKYQP